MQTKHLISADEFCVHYRVEHSFLVALQQTGLIEVETVNESSFIDPESLFELEKFARLHYDLDINVEGIEAISYLLQRIRDLQDEITALKNRLSLYEEAE